MTTIVTIEAHCSSDKEVKISVISGDTGEVFIIQDGETAERVVYDDLEITVLEIEKQQNA
jgi:hypothetical protein